MKGKFFMYDLEAGSFLNEQADTIEDSYYRQNIECAGLFSEKSFATLCPNNNSAADKYLKIPISQELLSTHTLGESAMFRDTDPKTQAVPQLEDGTLTGAKFYILTNHGFSGEVQDDKSEHMLPISDNFDMRFATLYDQASYNDARERLTAMGMPKGLIPTLSKVPATHELADDVLPIVIPLNEAQLQLLAQNEYKSGVREFSTELEVLMPDDIAIEREGYLNKDVYFPVISSIRKPSEHDKFAANVHVQDAKTGLDANISVCDLTDKVCKQAEHGYAMTVDAYDQICQYSGSYQIREDVRNDRCDVIYNQAYIEVDKQDGAQDFKDAITALSSEDALQL